MSLRAEASRITSCVSARTVFGLALLGASGLFLAGCGGDEEEKVAPPAQTAPAETLPEPVTTPPAETTGMEDQEDDAAEETRTVPEEELQGDEEAIRSEAVFTGRGGKITPARIEVPAYIAIRVILRNADGGSYGIEIEGQRLLVGHARRIAELELDGLLPQKRYEGESPQGDVVISATAEPGP